jgi:hypothetical protein
MTFWETLRYGLGIDPEPLSPEERKRWKAIADETLAILDGRLVFVKLKERADGNQHL